MAKYTLEDFMYSYHRYNGYCTSHRVQEKDLDDLVYKELSRLKSKAQDNWLAIEDEIKSGYRIKEIPIIKQGITNQ